MNLQNIKLSDQETAELQKFNLNPVLKGAVKKVMLGHIYSCGVVKEGEVMDSDVNFAFGLVMNQRGDRYDLTNDKIGEKLRAAVEGIAFLNDGFKTIETFKIEENKEKDNKNKAR